LHTSLDLSWNPPSLLYNGNRVSSAGVKRPGRENLMFRVVIVFTKSRQWDLSFSVSRRPSICTYC